MLSKEEKEMYENQIKAISEATEILKDANEEYYNSINNYIENRREEIYNAYCESNPELINSDTDFEDIPDDYIVEYIKGKLDE